MKKENKSSRHKQALLIWLAIYLLINLLTFLLGDVLGRLPQLLKTLVLTLIAVPVMFYGMIPLLNRMLSKWLHK